MNGVETRKVQQIGPSAVAITLPAEWVTRHGIEKGDELAVGSRGDGTLAVVSGSSQIESEVEIHAADLSGRAVERAIIAQYVLGRRVIRVITADGALDTTHFDAAYSAETQLVGLGIVEETPDEIVLQCWLDPDDFELDNLVARLESTGHTVRNDALDVLADGNPDLARRALDRETQANKIFVLVLRLVFSAHQNPTIATAVGLRTEFPLLAYRSIARTLELAADNARHIAEIALDRAETDADTDDAVLEDIREFTDHVDDLMQTSVRAALERDYALAIDVRTRVEDLDERGNELLDSLSAMPTDDLLPMHEVVVCLQQTVDCAVRIAETAANLAMGEHSPHTSVDSNAARGW